MKPTKPESFNKVLGWLDDGAPHVGDLAGFSMACLREKVKCGTVCCIAGAFGVFQEIRNCTRDELEVHAGMSEEDSEKLCCPSGFQDDETLNDPHRAARVIRHYLATGDVDWSIL